MPDKLKELFEGFGSRPSPELWASIEKKLQEQNRKKRFFFWIPTGMAAISIGLIFTYFLFQERDTVSPRRNRFSTQTDKIVNSESNSAKIKKEGFSDQTSEEKPPGETIKTGESGVKQNKNPQKGHRKQTEEPELQNPMLVEKQHIHTDRDSLQNGKELIVQQQEIPDEKKDSLKRENEAQDTSQTSPLITEKPNPIDVTPTPKDSLSKWQLRFSLGTWSSVNNRNQTISDISDQTSWTPSTTSLNEPLFAPTPNDLNSDSRVSILKPLSLSVQLARQLKKRAAIFGGFSLDQLISKNTYDSFYTICSYKSLGLNIGMDWKILERNRFSFRSGFVINNDLLLFKNTRTNTTSYLSASNINTVKGFQNSFQLDFALDYRIGKRSVLELKPGIREYLYQHIETNHFVLKRNFWYGVSVGYKWNF